MASHFVCSPAIGDRRVQRRLHRAARQAFGVQVTAPTPKDIKVDSRHHTTEGTETSRCRNMETMRCKERREVTR